MTLGSSGRPTDSQSNDILCSYDDQVGYKSLSDPPTTANSAEEFDKSRMARSSVSPTASYSTPEEFSFNQGVISTVENTMKKYTDNIMRFLEGISSRLSQLELYCYNLEKAIGEMHSDLVRDHGESESKLKSLEKHIQEVHRSVQILRDKQELADTQKELAKLQLAQKESSSPTNAQHNEEKASTPASEAKKGENASDSHNQQLALALPHQVAPQLSLPAQPLEHQQPSIAPPSSMPSQNMAQTQAYYLPRQQMTSIPAPSHPSQTQYLPTQSQVQDPSRMSPSQPQVNQNLQVQLLPPYQQQQWPQQHPVQTPQPPVINPQIRTSSQMVYPSYLPNRPNQSPAEMPPAGSDTIPYGYTGSGIPLQQHAPTQHLKAGYGPQLGEGYGPDGPRPAHPSGNAYMGFDGEGGRTRHPPPQPHFQQSAYPPSSIPPQNPQPMPSANMVVPQSIMRNQLYKELFEKLVGMGYRGDHIVGAIQRLEETGQPVDFNSVLDRLDGSGSQRGWSR